MFQLCLSFPRRSSIGRCHLQDSLSNSEGHRRFDFAEMMAMTSRPARPQLSLSALKAPRPLALVLALSRSRIIPENKGNPAVAGWRETVLKGKWRRRSHTLFTRNALILLHKKLSKIPHTTFNTTTEEASHARCILSTR